MPPLMDMSAALTNPYTLDDCECIRREEQINDYGEAVIVESAPVAVKGVITPAGQSLTRNPEFQIAPKSINIISKFAWRTQSKEGPSIDPPGGKAWEPDHVRWHGNTYIVIGTEDYSSWATGFTVALCQIVDRSSTPPVTR